MTTLKLFKQNMLWALLALIAGMTGSSILAMEKGSTSEEKEQSFPVITYADGMWHISRKTTLGQADESHIIYVTDQLYSAKDEDVAKGCALLRNLNLVPAEDADATILVDLAKEWGSSENARAHRCPFAWKVGHAFCYRELEQSKYPVILEYLIKNKADVTVSAICKHEVGGKRIDELLTNNIFPIAGLYYELDSSIKPSFSALKDKMREKKFHDSRITCAVQLLLGDLTIEAFADKAISASLADWEFEGLQFTKNVPYLANRFRGRIVEQLLDPELSPESRFKAFNVLAELYGQNRDLYYAPKKFNSQFVFALINSILDYMIDGDNQTIRPFPVANLPVEDRDKESLDKWNPAWPSIYKIYIAARWHKNANAHAALKHLEPIFTGNNGLTGLWAQNITRFETIKDTIARKESNPYLARAHDMLRYYRRPVIATTGILAAIAAVRFYSPLHASLGNLVNQGYRRVIAGVWNESGLVGSRVV